jgi:hypothetical protein
MPLFGLDWCGLELLGSVVLTGCESELTCV